MNSKHLMLNPSYLSISFFPFLVMLCLILGITVSITILSFLITMCCTTCYCPLQTKFVVASPDFVTRAINHRYFLKGEIEICFLLLMTYISTIKQMEYNHSVKSTTS